MARYYFPDKPAYRMASNQYESNYNDTHTHTGERTPIYPGFGRAPLAGANMRGWPGSQGSASLQGEPDTPDVADTPREPAVEPAPIEQDPRTALLYVVQVQLMSGGAIIATGDHLVFDTIITHTSPDIRYNEVTGTFTITAPGMYYVNWWVALSDVGPETPVIFSVETSQGLSAASGWPPPVTHPQLNGQTLLQITDTPVTMALVNKTSVPLAVSADMVQASLLIFQIAL